MATKKDLVAEFKKKVKEMDAATGYKYKVLYRGYKEALENKRLHVYWHKPCKLAEVTTPEGVVLFEIKGRLEGKLYSPDGCVLGVKDAIKPLTPFDTTTIDDVGISHDGISINTDQDLLKYLDAESGWHFEMSSASYVQASLGNEVYVFEDPSIAKDIFDINVVNMLIEKAKAEEEPVAEEPVPEEKPVVEEPVPEEEEPVVEEPVAVEEEVEAPPEEVEAPAEEVEVPAEEVEAPAEKAETSSPIKDSGHRTKFKSGAVRDVQRGKGRCDLLPLDIVGEFFECTPDKSEFEEIALYREDYDRSHLIKAAKTFAQKVFENDETAILEYACHLEDGCNKYGARNWEMGIPLERYIDSGIRHLLKYRRGDDDERHDRAFIWNMLCGAWTVKHHPELKELE